MRKFNYYYNSEILNKFAQIAANISLRYDIDDNNRKIIENVIKWLFGQDFEDSRGRGRLNKGIYLYGDCGTGKTVLMEALKNFSLEYKQKFIINGKEIRPFWKTYHANEICQKFRNGEDISPLNSIPILCVDDLGTEPEICQYMGNKSDVVKELLEIREDKGVITLITSNIDPFTPEFERRYGKRLTSRMRGLNFYSLLGEDRRLKSA